MHRTQLWLKGSREGRHATAESNIPVSGLNVVRDTTPMLEKKSDNNVENEIGTGFYRTT